MNEAAGSKQLPHSNATTYHECNDSNRPESLSLNNISLTERMDSSGKSHQVQKRSHNEESPVNKYERRNTALHRQSSTLTQVVSNCTIKGICLSRSDSSFDLQSSSLEMKVGQKCSDLRSSSFDEDKTTFSVTTAITEPVSFIASTPNTNSQTYMSFSDYNAEGDCHLDHFNAPPMPLHLEGNELETFSYYRVVYRGVVPLLSAPRENANRSGYYLSYGEVFRCRKVSCEEEHNNPLEPPTKPPNIRRGAIRDTKAITKPMLLGMIGLPPPPPRNNTNAVLSLEPSTIDKQQNSEQSDEEDYIVLKVDKVLTGGYAMDAPSKLYDVDFDAETPKRSNTFEYSPETPQSASGIEKYSGVDNESSPGFIFITKTDTRIAEQLSEQPLIKEDTFVYRITSSTPLPILTGPSFDAPKTKAVLLPGVVIGVSLRICFDPENSGVSFLRLSHRRGWIADRQCPTLGKVFKSFPVAVEISSDNNNLDEKSLSGQSVASTALSCVTTNSHRRHRPPRRRDEVHSAEISSEKHLPRKIVGKPSPLKSKLGMLDYTASDRLATPSSNVSILSFDSSFDNSTTSRQPVPTSPNPSNITSQSTKTNGSSVSVPSYSSFFLMHVTAPGGLKILDAPQFQVNNLIRGKNVNSNVSSSHSVSKLESAMGPPKTHHSIFQTMSSRLSTTGPSRTGGQAVFDARSKTRVLPRGSLFEASRRMENTGAFSQGAGLIKLSDNSGWAIVPCQDELDRQYRHFTGGGVTGVKEGEATRAYEEVGNSVSAPITHDSNRTGTVEGRWVRIVTRGGVRIYCTPIDLFGGDNDDSPSSRGSSTACGSFAGSVVGQSVSSDSEIASSVGSSFLDAMFRSPKKKETEKTAEVAPRSATKNENINLQSMPIIPCGYFVEVEKWAKVHDSFISQKYVRLRGGQGWLPLELDGKTTAVVSSKPEIRYGSFWFRVQSLRGIKVRTGPMRKAPSIKSDDGVHFRFECGEFLRSSEVATVFSDDGNPIESFAKLYRNRHVQLRTQDRDYVSLASLTVQAEWVQVYFENELFLEECSLEPRIERHKQGWRYNVVSESGVEVRKGPSFSSEKTGVTLLGGESILINERVSPPGDKITWLRMKDGQGWVYDVDEDGGNIMIAHALKYRAQLQNKQRNPEVPKEGDEIAYNTIIARLFNGGNADGIQQTRNASSTHR